MFVYLELYIVMAETSHFHEPQKTVSSFLWHFHTIPLLVSRKKYQIFWEKKEIYDIWTGLLENKEPLELLSK